MTLGTREATLGALGNLSFELNPSHRITFQNFYTHSGNDQARIFEGFNSDIATNIRNQRLYWAEEELLSTGFSGEHFFRGMASSRIDWRATLARAQRDEPDLREVLYEENAGEFVLADESQSGLRMFNELDDDSLDIAANWSTFSVLGGRPLQLKFGAQYVDRQRDFQSRRFRFVPLGFDGIDPSAPPEQLYTAANIGPNFEIKEETRTTDFYDAEQRTTAGYGMFDLAMAGNVRLVAGARVERFDLEVNTFDLFDFSDDPEIIPATILETDLVPSVNLVVSPRPDHNLRVGFSQTVNRPEFRELAPFEFTDVVGGRAVVGNPDLTRALIQNYDVRYEIFPGADQVLAASAFVKRFNDPIERIIEPTAQLRTSFTNADSARNLGFELEARRSLSDNVIVGGNYTWVDSKVTLSAAAAQVQTSLERPLVGQSGHVFNVFAQTAAGPAVVRVLYNYFDERISDVGAQGLPDIIEEGRGTLDLVLSARVRRLNIRFSAENLTDPSYEFTQGGQVQRTFKLGRTFAVNFGFSAF
jgi:TonB-dependent receptor